MSEKIPNEQVVESIKAEINYIAEEAYKKGLHAGESKCEYCDEYKHGQDDAWEAVRKIAAMPTEVTNQLFGYFGLQNILRNVAPSEAIAKLKAYEEQKSDSEIKVGDEVIATNGKAIVYGLFTDNDKTLGCRYLYSDGSIGWNSATILTKTGRHFPQIAEVLKAMKEVTE